MSPQTSSHATLAGHAGHARFADTTAMCSEECGLITELLRGWAEGQAEAQQELWPLVYQQLRSMAGRYLRQERQGHTLQPTALVHEAYLRLSTHNRMRWRDRGHFYAMATRVMRRILVDHARQRAAAKRGGDQVTVQLDEIEDLTVGCGTDLIEINDALRGLEAVDPEKAAVVELRIFGGLTARESAEILGCSEKTVQRRWVIARAWLYLQLKELDAG
jgi:RNA polymerase sigma factor (TIGR02999 family)